MRNFINIFVDEEEISLQKGLKTKLKNGAEVTIVPAIAGGITII